MPGARLLAVVEGETEEAFVNQVLTPYLGRRGYDSVSARILGNARLRSKRGGIKPWPGVRREIIRHLREDARVILTTMVDFYGLPRSGDRAWPGFPVRIEAEMATEVAAGYGSGFRAGRFVPYVVMHEFEGLLFSDCAAFARGLFTDRAEAVEAKLTEIRQGFESPEDINDSPETHPSARVEEIIPGYRKPLQGVIAAQEVGIDSMMEECPQFANWIRRLEESGR